MSLKGLIGSWCEVALLTVVSLGFVACGGDEEDPKETPDVMQGALEVEGQWGSAFGGVDEIGEGKWGGAAVVEYNNEENWAITQLPETDEFNPSKFNKLVWTEPKDNEFYYCWVDFGLDSADAAKATDKTADPAMPDEGGCGGFSWTKVKDLAASVELVGSWTSSFEMDELITPWAWGDAKLIEHNNEENWAITQLSETDEFNPSKFNKLVWTEPKDDEFYYCWVDFGLDSAAEAKATDKTADVSKLNDDGCGGFPWTKLSPMQAVTQ